MTNTNIGIKKYLPVSETDKSWGFVVHDVGQAIISPNTEYPPAGHPGSHRFCWEHGRILHEHHFVLITEGKGIFESHSAGVINLNAGDGFILFPNEWHRYKPGPKIGWTEYWIGFSGPITDLVMKDIFFTPKKPVVPNCANMVVQNLFKSLFQLILEEPFGFQRSASGICIQLIAEICNIKKNPDSNSDTQSFISKAKLLMNQKINEDFDLHLFCKHHGITYSKFRKDFKNQTGLAPLQYFLLIKIEKAKELLNTTDLRTKQIAFSLGFSSDHYFSRLFRAKTGFSPQHFRSKSGKCI
ncbi:helix-turn-helix domain-containing protein [Sunxiuqinia sp. A32]|uniref:helix-turn-helix domain-containing protein n=1 Tax=Sunxiuqinia sp. A32 TaxID=3461496 RepID=UPI004045BDFF